MPSGRLYLLTGTESNDFRHSGNIFALQKLLGHETQEMVRRYVELASDDVAEANQKASPVDGWRL